jgi:predicted O-methyltransferase YrrM
MIFENKVTRKSNLIENDSLSAYNGWAAQQNDGVYEVMYNFIKEVKPKQILEIGTALGGFTKFIAFACKNLNLDTKIISVDIHHKDWYQEIRDMGVELNIENIFSEDYTQVNQKYVDFIKQDGTTIVFCDGGDKVKEFNVLSDFLKVGDLILAHDFAIDRDYFNEHIYQKIWNWLEITESDIKNACERNNLVDFQKEVFHNVVWCSKQKIK